MSSNNFPILSWRRIIIDGKESQYIISDKGIVMNDATGEFMLISRDKDDYPVVKLFIDGEDKVFKVHRLCCNAFNSNPFDLQEVDHKNRNHWDCSKENLEYVDGDENHRRLYKLREIEKSHLANYKQVAKNRTKLTELQIFQVCLRLLKHEKISSISKKTSVDTRTIHLIREGKIWKNISCYFSFDNDGMFDDETIEEIKYYIDNGFTNKAILVQLNLDDYEDYFISFIDNIRKVYLEG